MKLNRRGILFVLSSPSGAGKSSIAKNILDKDENIMTFITDYKLDNSRGQKRSLKIIQKEEEKRGRLMTKFGIGDEELEDIFDLIAEEHPDL